MARKRREKPRSQQRQQRDRDDAPVVHEGAPFVPPPAIARFAVPAVFIPVGLAAGALLFLVAFLIRDSSDEPPQVQPPPGETPTTPATPAGTSTPDPRIFSQAEDVIDAENFDYRASVVTNAGAFQIDLFEDLAPNTVNSFVFLVNQGFYDGLKWHRVVENFVVQAGDPRSAEGADPTGIDGPGYETSDERNDLSNTRGRISMAKRANATTFGSQFFINLKDNPALDDANSEGDAFYPFGEVILGMDVVDRITEGDVIQRIEIEAVPKEPDEGDAD